MYNVTVFTLKTCPHCIRAKAFLRQEIPAEKLNLIEISLTDYPEKRLDMLQLADKLTVPQIFLGKKHIGGREELQRLIGGQPSERNTAETALQDENRNMISSEFFSVLERFALDLPADPRMLPPSYPPPVASGEYAKIAMATEIAEPKVVLKKIFVPTSSSSSEEPESQKSGGNHKVELGYVTLVRSLTEKLNLLTNPYDQEQGREGFFSRLFFSSSAGAASTTSSTSGTAKSGRKRQFFRGSDLVAAVTEILLELSAAGDAEEAHEGLVLQPDDALSACAALLQQNVIYPRKNGPQLQSCSSSSSSNAANGFYFQPKKKYALTAYSGVLSGSKDNFVLNSFVPRNLLIPDEKNSNNLHTTERDQQGAPVETAPGEDHTTFPTYPLAVLKRARRFFDKVVSANTDSETGLVDYGRMAASPEFDQFRVAISYLQLLDLNVHLKKRNEAFGENVAKAFWINCYNLLVLHAFAEAGIAEFDLGRLHFFAAVKYQFSFSAGAFISGTTSEENIFSSHSTTTTQQDNYAIKPLLPFSLHEIENGILRGNLPGAIQMKPPFSPDRLKNEKFILPRGEYRLHFALNCGARSCPPIKWFSAEACDEELRIVSMAFLEQEENLAVSENEGTKSAVLYLSKIFHWYSRDFTTTTSRNYRYNSQHEDVGTPSRMDTTSSAGEVGQDQDVLETPYNNDNFSDQQRLVSLLTRHTRGEKREKLVRLLQEQECSVKIEYNRYDWTTNSNGNHRKFAAWDLWDLWR
ncbi:unnamed protein product [Amoebophrya sp. A120]|nr:unnamed protein product [Amoebophrya sp. A120]|eukprot:GSA120T00000463001.1